MYSVITLQAGLAAICWVIVGVGAGVAVMSTRINDILSERIALCMVSLSALGTAWRILDAGEVSERALWLAFSLALYVVSLFWKYSHHLAGTSRDKGTHA